VFAEASGISMDEAIAKTMKAMRIVVCEDPLLVVHIFFVVVTTTRASTASSQLSTNSFRSKGLSRDFIWF